LAGYNLANRWNIGQPQRTGPSGYRESAQFACPDLLNRRRYGAEHYEASGLIAPKNTPAGIISRLHTEIDASLMDPKLIARFADVGSVPKSMTPADFGKFITEDTEKSERKT
jgi:hypothetical protein